MSVIETAQFKLKPGASPDAFAKLNLVVETQFIDCQPGVVVGSRRTTVAEDGRWTVTLEWDTAAAAEASMARFSTAPEAREFMALVDADTMTMRRDTRVPAVEGALANARGLYLEGIRDGHVRDAVTRYTGSRYTQHSTGVRDGAEGFIEFFEPFIERNPQREIQLVRSFQDGRYVFVHAYQSINGGAAQWVTTDLFDSDPSGRIVEHWDVIASFTHPTPSGHTQVDGATEIVDIHLTESNKAVVAAFLDKVMVNGDFSVITDYVSPQQYVQHNNQVADGLDGLSDFVAKLAANGGHMIYNEVVHVVGQGNFVASLSRVDLSGTEMAVFDIFRLRDGLIVEHWDNMEPVPANDVNGGKF